jgi:hypothetical protein
VQFGDFFFKMPYVMESRVHLKLSQPFLPPVPLKGRAFRSNFFGRKPEQKRFTLQSFEQLVGKKK